MKTVLLRSLGGLLSLCAIGLGALWLSRRRLDYNSEGRYFDEQASVVYQDSAMMLYGLLFFVFLVLALLLLAMTLRKG